MGGGTWLATVHGVAKSRTRLSDFTHLWGSKMYIENWIFPGGSDGKAPAYNAYRVGDGVQSLGREDLLEKEMATHSSILAWKIPWVVEPGGLQSMRSQRV